jgi:hypothetical protein
LDLKLLEESQPKFGDFVLDIFQKVKEEYASIFIILPSLQCSFVTIIENEFKTFTMRKLLEVHFDVPLTSIYLYQDMPLIGGKLSIAIVEFKGYSMHHQFSFVQQFLSCLPLDAALMISPNVIQFQSYLHDLTIDDKMQNFGEQFNFLVTCDTISRSLPLG